MNAKSVEPCPAADGSGVFRAAEGLTRAASPVFALMALFSLRYEDARDLLCGAASGAPWNWHGHDVHANVRCASAAMVKAAIAPTKRQQLGAASGQSGPLTAVSSLGRPLADLCPTCAPKTRRSSVPGLRGTPRDDEGDWPPPGSRAKPRRGRAALIKPLSIGMTARKKGDNALSGTRDRHGPDRHQWPAFDVGACHRLVTAGTARGAGRKERHGFPPRAGAGV